MTTSKERARRKRVQAGGRQAVREEAGSEDEEPRREGVGTRGMNTQRRLTMCACRTAAAPYRDALKGGPQVV